MMKRKLFILVLTVILVFGFMWMLSLAADAPKKAAPKPPPPPAKVFEDGTPWVAVDQEAALERAHQKAPLVTEVLDETPSQRRQRLGDKAPGIKDMKYRYLMLDSPIIKNDPNAVEDLYGPVRFMHMKHAAVIDDCTKCHHLRPADKEASETTKCSACHQQAFMPQFPGRPGLKAAMHQQCMTCHKEEKKGPLACNDCHAKNVPAHKELVKLSDNPDPIAVTKECLRCHDDAAEDMLTSAHWLWRGPSPYTEGDEKRIDLGKASTTINNFCVALPSNWPRCTSCHAGYGWKDANFDFSDKTHMDCLVCHDTTGKYRKAPPAAGMPYPQIDLKEIAENVGKPSRKTCGDCHFQGGGGDAVKHGDMNGILYYPSRNCDVHMGGMDFQCHECHKTRNHKIAGRSLSLPVAEGSRTCEDCHTSQPHKYHMGEGHEGHNLLNHHLNRHTEHLFCVTCHSPVYAKCKPTKTWWDWSKAGDKKRKIKKDKYGMPDYNWMKGEFVWKESAKPAYAWYNGRVRRYLVGDKIKTDGVVKITEPVGDITDAKSRIYPFKLMRGKQMADAETNQLIVPHLFGEGGYWKTLDWEKSFANGMKAAGLEYSGKYKWVETVMYWGLTHETMPAENALGCAQCHPSLTEERTCDRCHQDNRHVDFKKLSTRGTDFEHMTTKGRDVGELIGQTDYLNFKALGYKGDPIVHGGRFKQLPLGGLLEADKKE
jgi:octaheme c-type cytochrome (tetrathionate reductase family)